MKVKPSSGSGAKAALLKSLWQAIWRFGKDESVDAHNDLAHRIAELERPKGMSNEPHRNNSSPA
jgi:hypothetical protein